MWRIFAFLLLFSTSAVAMDTGGCQGPYKNKRLTQVQLNQVLKQWRADKKAKRNLCGTNLHGLDFSNADLTQANFYGADLSRSKFVNADLSNSNLEKVFLRWSDLHKAKLFRARLIDAHLQNAQLKDADLRQTQGSNSDFNGADLTNANFIGSSLKNTYFGSTSASKANFSWCNLQQSSFEDANLQQTNFSHAKIINASLYGTDLSNSKFIEADLSNTNMVNTLMASTNFFGANMYKVHFQPRLKHKPDLVMLATAKNFRSIRFHHRLGIPALTELRTAYIKIGLRQMERKITAMLKIKSMQRAWEQGGFGVVESSFNYLFFYLTCDYGAAPGRPLLIFLIAIFLFALPYYLSLRLPSFHNGIKVCWQPEHYQQHVTLAKRETYLQHILHYRPSRYWLHEEYRVIRIALFFSLLSAFQIGWRELNIGNWISRLQRREYALRAFGWIRVLAGAQSLISVYLVVLWALTYFGRPFQW